jgi:acetylornithine deacetylase/succinyl-diaminopimelate desuccinylase-like protein
VADADTLLDAALRLVTDDVLREAAVGVTSIPSPTGREAPLAAWLAQRMRHAGIDAQAQHIDADQANAVGRVRGDGSAPDLMLYAPIDTLTTGDPALDVPWIGAELRPDMRSEPIVDGRYVHGLGASNPKGHAACVLVAAESLARASADLGIGLGGDLLVGLGAGGMPTNAIDYGDGIGRHNTGHGVGCSFMLERGWYADAAVIAKPGDFVAYDEVGLCWFEITVPGIHTYTGSRHRLPYANPIVLAADVVSRVEARLADYPARHRTATALPQGIIGSIAGGWERMLAVTPALCRIRLDIRIPPELPPIALKHELAGFVRALSAELGIELRLDLVNAIPGTRTDPGTPVIVETIRAWEAASGRPHSPILDNSGATDANILRARGVPTARVGMPKVADPERNVDFALGMNLVDVAAMRRLAEILLRVAVAMTARGGARPPSTAQSTEEHA